MWREFRSEELPENGVLFIGRLRRQSELGLLVEAMDALTGRCAGRRTPCHWRWGGGVGATRTTAEAPHRSSRIGAVKYMMMQQSPNQSAMPDRLLSRRCGPQRCAPIRVESAARCARCAQPDIWPRTLLRDRRNERLPLREERGCLSPSRCASSGVGHGCEQSASRRGECIRGVLTLNSPPLGERLLRILEQA